MIILNQMGMRYLSEWAFPRRSEYRGNGPLETYTAGLVIVDSRFYNGALGIEGSGSASKDNEKRDLHFSGLGLWIEHLANESMGEEEIQAALGRHKRADEYSRLRSRSEGAESPACPPM